MKELFESLEINQDMKDELSEAFDAAVLKETTKLIGEHTDAIIAEKVETLEEEYQEKVTSLTESLDGYLDTVVEEFKEENAPIYEAQIAEDKVQQILEAFDGIVKTTGATLIDIQEAKDDADKEASLETKVEQMEDKLANMADKLVESKREANKYLKAGVIMEMSKDLSVLEGAKFEKLAEMVEFSRDEKFTAKLDVIKESIIDQRAEAFKQGEIALPSDAFKHGKQVDTKSAMAFDKYI